jgi:hypothetical protein
MTTSKFSVEVGPRRLLPAFLAAVLVLVCGRTVGAAAPPRPGVTVLVHGFVALGGATSSPYEYWGGAGGENLTALLERFGSGLVWEYDPATGHYVNITHSTTGTGEYRIPRGDWSPAFAGHQILLFDWTAGSDDGEAGQAEAAADALFASLMEFHPGGEFILSTSPYAALKPLHFVGHSRGTVVVSETVQRLGRYNIRVNYVTYLDIHDFGQPGIASDEFFHDPAVQVWENVDYADAFYQENPAGMCGVNPAGRRLEHFRVGSRLQRDLTDHTALIGVGCTLHQRPHAWIKEYYWGTVATNGGYIGRPASWYEADGGDGTGRGFGFDRWWNRGGFEQGPELSITNRARCVVGADAIPYAWSPADEGGHSDHNGVPPVLFNGDFELPDLDGGIGGGNSLAGWFYFGGGGSAAVSGLANSYLLLNRDFPQARHNRFFLPPETRELKFAMRIILVPALGTHTLEVRFGSDVVRAFTIDEITADFVVYEVPEHLWAPYRGRVDTLSFVLVSSGSAAGPEVRIDNIGFVTEPVSWIHSFHRLDASTWRLIWRSWPDATFHVQSSSNFLHWRTVASGSAPSASGSFNIPHSSAPQVYVRGEADPAR